MKEGRLRWGILSTAHIARAAVVPAIKASRNGEVRAVGSRDGERSRAFASDLAIPQPYGSYPALLEAEDIDAIYVGLPNSLHREWTVKAAEAGKHVLCEKPLGATSSECEEMARAARENGVVLMEAFMYRFHPRTERVLKLVRESALGPLAAIQSAFTFRLRRSDDIRLSKELAGGALMDVGCYCVNVSRSLASAEPVEAQAFATWAPSGVDSRLSGTLRFERGLVAQFDCALDLERRESYVVAGPEGHLSVDAAFVPGEGETSIEERRGRSGRSIHVVPGADEYRLMVEHFADAVRERREVRYPASEAAANLRAIEALYRSARNEGRPEPVRP
jgi:predicted dehydrogenase